jgi:hypothetical protein
MPYSRHYDDLSDSILAMVARRLRAESRHPDLVRPGAAKTNPMETASSPPENEPTGNEPTENKPTAERATAHPDAPECTRAHPDANNKNAKRSHGGAPAATRTPALSPLKIRAVRLLLAGGGVGEVAAAVGVGRHTITRWVKDPAFEAEARRQVSLSVPLAATRTVRR